ncbi:MAG: AIR synthase-related protein [Eubacteriales bacterium]|nr:AIR synthase-related protein [Eubacteriales bacterium]
MKLGNVTGDIYDRSIHKKLNSRRRGVENGAAYGEDCAVFSVDFNAEKVAVAQAQAVYSGKECGKYAVYAAVNQAAVFGVRNPIGVLLNILLPAETGEQELRRIVEDAQAAADALGTAIADVKASVTAAVNAPVLSATAVGTTAGMFKKSGKMAENGQIVMTKWAGLEGSAILASRCFDRLRERYPSHLLEEAAGFGRMLSVLPEAAAAGKSGVSALCAAAEGGIFRALWTLAQRAGVGLEIDLKKIPIRQETVEICNYLDLNPYELAGNGSLLCITAHGETLLKELQREKIPAAIIGMATANNDKVIVNGEEKRFLEPAKMDEIYKILK